MILINCPRNKKKLNFLVGAFLSLTVGFFVILIWTKRHFGLLVSLSLFLSHTHTNIDIYKVVGASHTRPSEWTPHMLFTCGG